MTVNCNSYYDIVWYFTKNKSETYGDAKRLAAPVEFIYFK